MAHNRLKLWEAELCYLHIINAGSNMKNQPEKNTFPPSFMLTGPWFPFSNEFTSKAEKCPSFWHRCGVNPFVCPFLHDSSELLINGSIQVLQNADILPDVAWMCWITAYEMEFCQITASYFLLWSFIWLSWGLEGCVLTSIIVIHTLSDEHLRCQRSLLTWNLFLSSSCSV